MLLEDRKKNNYKGYKGAIYIIEAKVPLEINWETGHLPFIKEELSCGGCWLYLRKCIGHELSIWSVSR